MEARQHIAGGERQILVIGLGASGASVLRHVARSGARVIATDSRPAPPGIETLRLQFPRVEFRLGGFSAAEPLAGFDQAIVSPGVALREPLVQSLLAAGVEVAGDIELFARAVRAPVVAITGSNGKSTVTTLIGEMARRAGVRVAVGGNLGPPALDLLDDAVELYVLEISSFQLETTCSLRPRAAVWLNLSEDHLDRHGTMAVYAAIKARVFRGAEVSVVNRDDPAVCRYAPDGAVGFSLAAPAGDDYGVFEYEGERWLARGRHRLLPLHDLRMVGMHNAANALAALAAAAAANVPEAAALATLREFSGLPHRCEWVADTAGVRWINDSKGTNVGATLAALGGLTGPIVWLGGGQGKGQDFAPLAPALAGKARCALVFGAAAAELQQVLEGSVPVRRVATLDEAVVVARDLAQPGDQVLLSPACASLDQFRDYAERGNRFRALAQEMRS